MKRFEYDEAETCYTCHGLVENEQGHFVRYEDAQKRIVEHTAENQKLKEALRFYAHRKHFTRDVILDEGNIARAALGCDG